MKEQLKIESFEDFGMTNQDSCVIIGKIVNMQSEDTKLQVNHIGLININPDTNTNIMKIKLNLTEVPTYSLFEGEVIVVEGINDMNGQFNVRRIIKPPMQKPLCNFSPDFLRQCAMYSANKPLQFVTACGPFSSSNYLEY
jgi:hypothetical protein